MAVKTITKRLSDGVAYEGEVQYTRESYTIRNPTATEATLADPLLYPLNLNAGKMELAIATGEAGIDGLLLRTEAMESIAATSDYPKKQAVLVRGPAIIRRSMLPATDVDGAAFTIATLITRLAALTPPIIVHDEPPQMTVQTE